MPYRANILRNAYIVYIHPILVIEVQGHYFLDVKLLNFLIEGQCDIMIWWKLLKIINNLLWILGFIVKRNVILQQSAW